MTNDPTAPKGQQADNDGCSCGFWPCRHHPASDPQENYRPEQPQPQGQPPNTRISDPAIPVSEGKLELGRQITCTICGRENVPDWDGKGHCIKDARDLVLGDELDKILAFGNDDPTFIHDIHVLIGEGRVPRAKEELQNLIDQQVDAALDAADAALPGKREYGPYDLPLLVRQIEDENRIIDQAHEVIRALRRKEDNET